MTLLLFGGIGATVSSTITPSTKAYGSIAVGASSPQTYTVTNTGGTDFTIGSIHIAGSDAFAVESDTCTGATLAPAATCTFVGRFTPTAPGDYAATIELLSDDLSPTIPTADLTGSSPTGPVVSVSPASWDAGVLSLGNFVDVEITTTNVGDAALTIGVTTLTGDTQFSFQTNDCWNQVIAPGNSCSAIIRFTPTDEVNRAATYTVPSDDPLSPYLVSLIGDAVDEGAQLDLDFKETSEPTVAQDPAELDSPGTGTSFTAYHLGGMHNSNFRSTPDDPNSNIDVYTSSASSNFLPSWRFVQSSNTNISAAWVSDVSGGAFRFTLAAGSANDEAYLEQTFQIYSSQNKPVGFTVTGTLTSQTMSSASVTNYLETQYLTASGAAVGSSSSDNTGSGFSSSTPLVARASAGIPPVNAFFLRVRLVLRRGVASTAATGTVIWDDVIVSQYNLTTEIPDLVNPVTYTFGRIRQSSGVLSILPNANGGASPVQGYVQIGPAGIIPLLTNIDSTTSSGSFGDMTNLNFPVLSGKFYRINISGTYTVNNVATGLGLAYNHPGGTARVLSTIYSTSTTSPTREWLTATDTATGTTTTDTTNSHLWQFEGTYACTTSGTFSLRFNRNGTSSTVTILAGSGGVVTVN